MTVIDYRQLIAEMPKDQRKVLTARSDSVGLRHLALHLSAIALAACYVVLELPWFGIAMFIEGVLIVFLFTALHETIHRTAFRSQWLNDVVATFCGFLVFLAPNWFRYFHFDHHRYTHDPEKDPELAAPKPQTSIGHLIYMLGIIETLQRIKVLVKNALFANTDSFVPEENRRLIAREARLFLLGYLLIIGISMAFGSTLVLWIWLIPMLLGNPLLRGYLLAEHSGCPHVSNMLENTRTMFTNGIVRFIAWNMPYHVEHHVYPGIPFHQLPAFHEWIKSHIQHTEKGYLRFNRKYLRALG